MFAKCFLCKYHCDATQYSITIKDKTFGPLCPDCMCNEFEKSKKTGGTKRNFGYLFMQKFRKS